MFRKRGWEDGRIDLHGADRSAAKVIATQTEVDGNVLNVRPDPVDFRDRIYEAGLVRVEASLVPLASDLVDVPVRSQGSEGSCTGQALAAVIDMQNVCRYEEGAGVPKTVSARMLYEQARAFDEFTEDGLPGSSARGAIKGFYHRGVCDALLAPYFDGDVSFKLTIERAKDARRVTLGSYFRLRHILNDYHAALNETRAIFCTAMIHNGWRDMKLNAGLIPFPTDRQVPLIGAHAFAIVGYTSNGFVVLNSWGPDWGGIDAAGIVDALRSPADAVKRNDRLVGMALWSYDDWRANVLDAWVIRLQAPTLRATGFRGGYYQTTGATKGVQQNLSGTTPASAIGGHYIHVRNGELVAEPPYDSTLSSIKETADFVAADGEEPAGKSKYDHLVFYAHGGLNNLDNAVARAGAMTEVFKRNRIYPIFYIWRTGIGDSAFDLVNVARDRILGRAGGVLSALSDALIERTAGELGRALWTDMKRNAALCSDRSHGAGWEATKILLDAAQGRKANPMKAHFIGHSAGAILLGDLFARALAEKHPVNNGTLSLFAPACTTDFFSQTFGPLAKSMTTPDSFAIYHLSDAAERADNVVQIYRKSLLYLVSNAFEDKAPEPLAGMENFIAKLDLPTTVARYVAPKASQSLSTSHGGFDNDPTTMNHVLGRILGKPVSALKWTGFTAGQLAFE
ncbi:C1 family peptidase [Mesorhizobium sp. M0296]|uniref:C1 family peptidase n=1 Tax=Mesorhizobium sp. M0296 TaxID=2956931 RepID=UPI00333687A7